MEMKGVCNEFLSARVPDPTAISQLRGENQRDRERVERWGSEMEARRGSRENTGLFFIIYTPFFSASLPSCYNVKLAFLLVYREQCGTVTWRQERSGEWFWRGVFERGRRKMEEKSKADDIMIGLKGTKGKSVFSTRTYG